MPQNRNHESTLQAPGEHEFRPFTGQAQLVVDYKPWQFLLTIDGLESNRDFLLARLPGDRYPFGMDAAATVSLLLEATPLYLQVKQSGLDESVTVTRTSVVEHHMDRVGLYLRLAVFDA